jgi:glycosyltransferase involved in cell wall biosynthesis
MFFSIITCTHNPKLNIFERLFKAVEALKITNEVDFEWIIVDNNSSPPIENFNFVQKYILNNEKFKVIIEPTPGLSNARIAGVNNCQSEWVVFFDDDNEPNQEYLIEANELITNCQQVVCWGPGKISVSFHGGKVPNWILNKKDIFQEKDFNGVLFSNNSGWQDFYPAGTGLIIKKHILLEYVSKVKSAHYTLTGRLNKNLSSGEDTQMVLLALKNGFYVGVADSLVMGHLIHVNKTKFDYLKKLFFATSTIYIRAYNEVFFDKPLEVIRKNNLQIVKRLLLFLVSNKKKIFKTYTILLLIREIGKINAHYFVYDKTSKPILMKMLEFIITH